MGFVIGEGREFGGAGALAERALVLSEESDQQVKLALAHIDDVRHLGVECVAVRKEREFPRQALFEGLLNASEKVLAMGSRVEVAVEVRLKMLNRRFFS